MKKWKDILEDRNKKNIRRLALLRLFSSVFFGQSIFCNSFLYLHLFSYLLFHTLDPFKLYTNTPNYLDMSFNSSF